MKRKLFRVLVILMVTGVCIYQSKDTEETTYPQDEAVVKSSQNQEKIVFPEIKVIDNIKEVEKITGGESDTNTVRANILTDKSYLPIERYREISRETALHSIRVNNIQFAVPEDGGTRGFGYPVFSTDYMSVRELETLQNWNAMYAAIGEDCPACNDGIEAARKWIAEGNLQEPIEKFLMQYPEISPEKREYVLYITSAEETFRAEDETSWWEIDYYLGTKTEYGENLCLAYGDIYRTAMVHGDEEPEWYDDAHYRILEQNNSMWKLLEKPEEDRGEIWIDFIEDKPGEEGFSAFYQVPEEDKEEWMRNYLIQNGAKLMLPSGIDEKIHWTCHREEDFWYDYMVCVGETSEYELKMEIPLMPAGSGNWYMASRIRKGALDKETCSHALSAMRETFHAVPYEYVVKEGDSLAEIAEKYLMDQSRYVRLAGNNAIKEPDLIYPGERIVISE